MSDDELFELFKTAGLDQEIQPSFEDLMEAIDKNVQSLTPSEKSKTIELLESLKKDFESKHFAKKEEQMWKYTFVNSYYKQISLITQLISKLNSPTQNLKHGDN